jgi:hypothetical protein
MFFFYLQNGYSVCVCVCVCTILRQSTANLFLPLQLSLFLRLPRDFETRRFDFKGGVFTLNEHPPFLLKNKVLYSFHSMKSVVSYTEELQWAFTKNKKTWSLIWLSLLKMCWGFYFILLEGTVLQRDRQEKKKAEANVKIQKTCDSWKEKERDLNPPIRIVSFHPLKKKKKKTLFTSFIIYK